VRGVTPDRVRQPAGRHPSFDRAVLAEGDDDRVDKARAHERDHKNRAGVIQATERTLSNA
jgi:hypothetical protein